jgi:hypothetical protein
LAWKKFLLYGDSASPAAHASTHQDGGSDEINIAGLSGEPAELTTHKGLATGVHGAGSNYLALAPAASHLVRTFTKGWTANKLLKGAGVDANPTEISGWQVVSEVVLASAAQSVDFTNLDINTDKMYKLFITTKNVALSGALQLFREGDYTTTNYYAQSFGADGSTVSAVRLNEPRLLTFPSGLNTFLDISIFRTIDGYMEAFSIPFYGSVTTPVLGSWLISSTNTTTNITSLKVYSTTVSSLAANSTFVLCKPRTG